MRVASTLLSFYPYSRWGVVADQNFHVGRLVHAGADRTAELVGGLPQHAQRMDAVLRHAIGGIHCLLVCGEPRGRIYAARMIQTSRENKRGGWGVIIAVRS